MHILLSKDNGETWQLQEPAFATIGNDSWNGLYPLEKGKVAALTSTNHSGISRIEIKIGSLQKIR